VDRISKFTASIDRELDFILSEGKEPKTKKPSCFLSKEQIDEHFDNHYQGYLKGLEAAQEKINRSSLEGVSHNGDDYRSALFDLSFNYNGVVLHELYFGSLGATDMPKDLEKLLKRDFGSVKHFKKLLKATLMGSKGWALLGFDPRSKKLFLSLIDSHDCSVPLIYPAMALDVWEHAYYVDYKSKKEDYVDDLIADINWKFVSDNLAGWVNQE